MESNQRGMNDTFIAIDEVAYINDEQTENGVEIDNTPEAIGEFTPVVSLEDAHKEMTIEDIEKLKNQIEEEYNYEIPRSRGRVKAKLNNKQLNKKKAKAKAAKKSKQKNRKK